MIAVCSNTADMMTPCEAAKFLRVSRPTIYRLLKSGAIPATRVGGRVLRVPKAALLERLRSCEIVAS